MKCLNCAAPTEPVPGGNYFCARCQNYQLPRDLEVSIDGVLPSSNEIRHYCPTCDGSQLVAGMLDEAKVAFCNSCRGILIVGQTLSMVLSHRRKQSEYREEFLRPVNQQELHRNVYCPVCHLTMEVHPYYGPGNAVIDSCFRCKVLWLDHGEVTVLERAPGR
jgi:Zn-finger nucleic acid-binding protein